MTKSTYNTLTDKWSTLHLIAGWIITLTLYLYFNSIIPTLLIMPMLIIIWEIVENTVIKPYISQNAKTETKLNITGDIIWTLLGSILTIATIYILTL